MLRYWPSLLVLCCAVGVHAFEVNYGEPLMRTSADLLISDAAVPPPATAAWRPVTLPESWRSPERYRQGVQGWYRFRIVRPAGDADTPWSVYLWRFSMNAEVWFNGDHLGSGGSFEEPIARNWNRPLLFAIPRATWRDGVNEVYVRLRVYPGFGHMPPIAVGPTHLLEPDYQQRFFTQITLTQLAWLTALVNALVGLAMWATNRRDVTPLYFALCGIAWSVSPANQFVQNIPMSAQLWWQLTHTAYDWFGVLLVLFMHRLFSVQRPRVEAVVLAWGALVAVTYALIDLPQLARINPIMHLGLLVIAVDLVLLLWRQWRQTRSRDALLFLIIIALLLLLTIHDTLLNTLLVPNVWRTQSYLAQFGAALMFFVFMVHLSARLARSLRTTQQANDELEAKVAAATAEIETAYQQRAELQSEQAASAERERIYRDLHDDVGARLLSLVYTANNEHQAGIARRALAEMRTIVSSQPLQGGSLAAIAADWRLETESRCEEAGFTLHWQISGDAQLSARERYQLDRILRELVSNALQHSGGANISVVMTAANDQIQLRVADDGRGFGTPVRIGSRSGTGLNSIGQRTRDIGGSAEWTAGDGGGTVCSVRVALATRTGGWGVAR